MRRSQRVQFRDEIPTVAPVSGGRTRERAEPRRSSVPMRTFVRCRGLGTVDPRTAFVLLHVDGISTVEEIVTMSGMSLEEVTTRLRDLCDRDLVRLRVPVPTASSIRLRG